MKALFTDPTTMVRCDSEVAVTEEQGTMMLTIAAVDGSRAVKVPLVTLIDAALAVLRGRITPPGRIR